MMCKCKNVELYIAKKKAERERVERSDRFEEKESERTGVNHRIKSLSAFDCEARGSLTIREGEQGPRPRVDDRGFFKAAPEVYGTFNPS